MEFGIMCPGDVNLVSRAVQAEQLGYSQAWFGDSPMMYSEVLVTMALTARATTKMKVGSGVMIAGLRLPHVAAAGLASINRIAPGRVQVAFGSGNTAYRDLGLVKPVKLDALRKYIQTVRSLLSNEEAWFEYNEHRNPIKWLMPEWNMINVEDRIPIYLGATGPKTQQTAGELTDGLFDGWGSMAMLPAVKENLRKGAERAGKNADDLALWGPSNIIMLEPGEDLTSDRVIDEAGISVAIVIHSLYQQFADSTSEEVPPFLAPFWDEYRALMKQWKDPQRFHYRANAGHGVFIHPDERKFITPALIDMLCVVGRAEELVERIRSWEADGVTNVNLYTNQTTGDRRMHKFAEQVIAKY
ncbi:LLM class flavin-dependent oxidoreductase [Streptomyces sp. NPDC048002]|uniref:LLM class flavin-dependent oxidoreductase n=1 Tax=Streptomyces sp. NPDC048002 TaxID=3154344 RepID=UPI0033EA5FC1